MKNRLPNLSPSFDRYVLSSRIINPWNFGWLGLEVRSRIAYPYRLDGLCFFSLLMLLA